MMAVVLATAVCSPEGLRGAAYHTKCTIFFWHAFTHKFSHWLFRHLQEKAEMERIRMLTVP